VQLFQTARRSAAGVLLGKPDVDWLYGLMTWPFAAGAAAADNHSVTHRAAMLLTR
jgi:hypothetical protein